MHGIAQGIECVHAIVVAILQNAHTVLTRFRCISLHFTSILWTLPKVPGRDLRQFPRIPRMLVTGRWGKSEEVYTRRLSQQFPLWEVNAAKLQADLSPAQVPEPAVRPPSACKPLIMKCCPGTTVRPPSAFVINWTSPDSIRDLANHPGRCPPSVCREHTLSRVVHLIPCRVGPMRLPKGQWSDLPVHTSYYESSPIPKLL